MNHSLWCCSKWQLREKKNLLHLIYSKWFQKKVKLHEKKKQTKFVRMFISVRIRAFSSMNKHWTHGNSNKTNVDEVPVFFSLDFSLDYTHFPEYGRMWPIFSLLKMLKNVRFQFESLFNEHKHTASLCLEENVQPWLVKLTNHK